MSSLTSGLTDKRIVTDAVAASSISTSTPNLNDGRSEKEKSLAGELYNAVKDPELTLERQEIKHLCYLLNQTSPLDIEKRKEITRQIFQNSSHDIKNMDITVESPFNCDYGYNIQFTGTNFYANHGCTILDCNIIKIGQNCLLAPHVCISAATHPLQAKLRANDLELTAPITIGNNVWIGACAFIGPGVTIGDNVVIGAGSVVVKSIPRNVVVAGVPAKIIRTLTEEGDVP
jgi:maltose O-acetyltransferase